MAQLREEQLDQALDHKDAGHFDNDELQPGDAPNDELAAPLPLRFRSRQWSLLASVVLLGIGIGVCAGFLTLMLYAVEHTALGFVESPELPGPFETDWRRRAISAIVGATIAAVLWWLLRTKSKRVPSVKQAVGGALMPVWQTVVHVLLQIFIVGTGLSVGREVAPRELGAMFGQRLSRWMRLNDLDMRTIVAVTAGAGLAGVYDAPLAGAFFTIEILLVDVTLEKVALSFICSSLAAWVATLIKGSHVFYVIGHVDAHFSPDLMLFAIPAGLVLGVCGGLFRRGSKWAESHKASGNMILWMLPLAGVVTGVVAIWVPQVMGNGRATAQMGFGGAPVMSLIPLLLLSFAAKAVVTLLTIRSGASGGVLTPGIALGASMGCILGILWMQFAGTNSIGVYALLGACALLSASQNAPLMAMSLVMELTQAPSNLFVPVAFISMIAVLASRIILRNHDTRKA
ncbi:chloride channel protein [Bifidobacterium magnum]|uniref:Voltage-gated ClC-type chloride channel ClcB n=1 Tax=Bifidobacterium magnum TaxID=1692 RepID=A0A087BCC0_9BIFI|nr:chloride channel protein [Bifidobacterium magnum]KFI68670.1 Voltage-gated ClC-type chloride channel ClcB [Bifidobacterium magnum]